MPRYDYRCENCNYELNDIYQSFQDKPLKKCKNCKKMTLHRVVFSPHVYVRGEPTTMGQLAERNSKKMGKTQVEEMSKKDKESKQSALKEAKNEMRSKINKMNNSQKRSYIENGRL